MISRICYHPSDTAEHLSSTSSDHLWYKLNYNLADQHKGELKFGKFKNKITGTSLTRVTAIAAQAERRRLEALTKMALDYDVFSFQLTGLSFIVHGMGAAHVTENNLTLHPIYGVPYVPSSSIKGVLLRWLIDAYCDGRKEKFLVDNSLAARIGRALFGTLDKKGIMSTFDILFHQGLQISVDVLTPHFSKYYSNNIPPSDTMNPVPNSFYTASVKEAQLSLAVENRKLNRLLQDEELERNDFQRVLNYWVKAAFKEVGVGSKTSSGYGRFIIGEDAKVISAVDNATLQEQVSGKEQTMLPEERLQLHIHKLTSSDLEESKKLYLKVIALQNKSAAQLLKKYWKDQGQWATSGRKISKKQVEKCIAIDKLINITE